MVVLHKLSLVHGLYKMLLVNKVVETPYYTGSMHMGHAL